jgi:four helix bundle protein
MGDYKKLLVWQHACALASRIEKMVKTLPPAEQRRIGDQLIRAADSIRFNIVEGVGLNSDAQFARHLLIALGSANEAQDELESINERGLLLECYQDLIPSVARLRAMLAGLHKRVSATKLRTSSIR